MEVFVHLYEETEYRYAEKINGDFASVLWDSNNKRLLLSRDVVGTKPIYYTFVNGSLFFASEIKSILEYDEIKRELDYEALCHYLSCGATPHSKTLIKQVKKLPPGAVLVVANGEATIKRYWNLKACVPTKNSWKGFLEDLNMNLKEAVDIRIPQNDEPIAVCLSGGIDSSLVTGLLSNMVERSIETYTAGFSGCSNEFEYARTVADHFGTNHHELIIEYDIVRKLLPKMVWQLDDLNADTIFIPHYFLSESIAPHASVVFDGMGGDELFGGYLKHLLMSRWFDVLPANIRFFLFSKVPLIRSKSHSFSEGDIRKLLLSEHFNKDELKIPSLVEPYYIKCNTFEAYRRQLEYDIMFSIQNEIIPIEQMSVAHSLEMRYPLLDINLIKFSASLPPSFKVMGTNQKFILREYMRNLFPDSIVKRKKSPFRVYLQPLFDDAFREEMMITLLDFRLFNNDLIKNLFSEPKKYANPLSRAKYFANMWYLSALAHYLKCYFERERIKKPSHFN